MNVRKYGGHELPLLTLYFLTYRVGSWFALPARDAVAFNSTGRNFELSIGIALTTFAVAPALQAVTTGREVF